MSACPNFISITNVLISASLFATIYSCIFMINLLCTLFCRHHTTYLRGRRPIDKNDPRNSRQLGRICFHLMQTTTHFISIDVYTLCLHSSYEHCKAGFVNNMLLWSSITSLSTILSYFSH